MTKFLLITDIEFWKENAGNAKRISQLILNFKNNNIELDIAFIGKIYRKEWIEKKYSINIQEISSLKNYLAIQCKKIINKFPYFRKKIRENLKHTTIENMKFIKLKKKMEEIYGNLEGYSGVIVEYIYLDYLMPEEFEGKKIIDTHDIQSDRYISYLKKNKFCRFKIFPEEEKNILHKYDFILLVSERDLKIVQRFEIIETKLIYLPIYEEVKKIKALPSTKLRIGFIGAAIDFNIDAINWFIKNVFVRLENKNIELHIYGGVSGLVKSNNRNIITHGFIKNIDDAYRNVDIIINPIQIGGGIKVKNIEAMSKGKLLITSGIGAQGLEDGVNKAFLLANSPEEYISIIKKYLEKSLPINKIEENAMMYIRKKLDYQKHYSEFFKKILGDN